MITKIKTATSDIVLKGVVKNEISIVHNNKTAVPRPETNTLLRYKPVLTLDDIAYSILEIYGSPLHGYATNVHNVIALVQKISTTAKRHGACKKNNKELEIISV